MKKFCVNVLGYIEDDSYTEKALSELIKKDPSIMQFKITGVIVQEMKSNPISIDSKQVREPRRLFSKK